MNISQLEHEDALDTLAARFDSDDSQVERAYRSFDQLTEDLHEAEAEITSLTYEVEDLKRDLAAAYELIEKSGLVTTPDRKAIRWALLKVEAPK